MGAAAQGCGPVCAAFLFYGFLPGKQRWDWIREQATEAESGTLSLAMCVVKPGELWYIIARADSPAQVDAT